MDKIIVFTDGAVPNNRANSEKGGIGIYFPKNNLLNKSIKYTNNDMKITNQTMELFAAYKALSIIIENFDIHNRIIYVYTDSKYMVNIINSWADKWIKNDWRKSDGKIIENLEIIKKLYFLTKNINVQFKHIRSHTKEPTNKDTKEYFKWYGNFQADKLATECLK